MRSSSAASFSGAVLGLALGGCGGRSALPDDACAWRATRDPPVAITDPSQPTALGTMSADGHRVLFGTHVPSTARAIVVSDDLASIGSPHPFASWPGPGTTPPGTHTLPPVVAIGHGHQGAILWDSAQGCRFAPLAADGSPSGPLVTLSTADTCFSLWATPSGFTVLTATYWFEPGAQNLSLLELDTSGAVVGGQPSITPSTDALLFGHARFDDGTMLVAWEDGGSLSVQHFSAAGQPLAPPRSLGSLVPIDSGHALMLRGLGSSALAGSWSVPDGGAGATTVSMAALDADGEVTSSTTLTVEHPFALVGSAREVAFLGWAAGEHLFVQPLSGDGRLAGEPIGVPEARETGGIGVVGTGAGALLAYEAHAPGAAVQVFATPLRCE